MTVTTRPKRPREPLQKRATPKSRQTAKQVAANGNGKPIVPAGAEASREVTRDTRKIEVAKTVPHPDNRQVSPPDCVDLIESIREHGQLVRILVRKVHDHYQLLAGERRWWAAQALDLKELDATVYEGLSDAAALEILAIENAQRKDLNDIEKARSIERLCQDAEEGGGGLTREAAGKIYSMSASGASNLARLLELSDVWQQRIISGEMPQTFGRELLPYMHCEVVIKAANKDYREASKDKNGWHWEEGWATRKSVSQNMEGIVSELTRSVTKSKLWHAPKFKIDDELRKKLNVVELPEEAGEKPVPRALNVKLWDELQEKARQSQDNRASGGAKKKKKAAAKKDPTPAELRAKAAEAKKRLAQQVTTWRIAWIRKLLAENLELGHWQVSKMLVYLAGHNNHNLHWSRREKACRDSIEAAQHKSRSDTWKSLEFIDIGNSETLAKDFVRFMLWPANGNCEPHNLPAEVIQDLALGCELDLPALWRKAQIGKMDAMLIKFFDLHNKDQLETLAGEMKVNLHGCKSKGDMVKKFTTAAKTLPMPKSIAALKAKRKKAKK